MWMLTNIGFFSIIERPEDIERKLVTIRARVRSDLETLKKLYLPEMGQITESVETDYRYRARAVKRDLHKAMHKLVDGISYRNFKDEVCATQGLERADLYAEVWATHYKMQRDQRAYECEADEVIHKIAVPSTSNHCAVVLDLDHRVLVRVDERDDQKSLFFHLQARSLHRPQDDLLQHLYQVTGYMGKTAAKCVIPVRKGFEDWVSYTIQLDGTAEMPENELYSFKWVQFDEVSGLIAKGTNDNARRRDKDHFHEAAVRVVMGMLH